MLLFNNYLHKKPSNDTAKDLSGTDIEVIVKNLKCSSGKFDSITIKDLESYALMGNNLNLLSRM